MRLRSRGSAPAPLAPAAHLADVTFTRPTGAPDLVITVNGTTDQLTIKGQFEGIKLDLFNILGIAWFDRASVSFGCSPRGSAAAGLGIWPGPGFFCSNFRRMRGRRTSTNLARSPQRPGAASRQETALPKQSLCTSGRSQVGSWPADMAARC